MMVNGATGGSRELVIDAVHVGLFVVIGRLANILHSVYSCGEYDRLMQGVFENYPQIKFKDSYMNAVS